MADSLIIDNVLTKQIKQSLFGLLFSKTEPETVLVNYMPKSSVFLSLYPPPATPLIFILNTKKRNFCFSVSLCLLKTILKTSSVWVCLGLILKNFEILMQNIVFLHFSVLHIFCDCLTELCCSLNLTFAFSTSNYFFHTKFLEVF